MIVHKVKTILGLEPTCEEVNGFIVKYLEGALDEKTQKRFLAHVRHCSTCGRFLDQYRATVDLTREAGEISAPPELIDETLSFLRSHWTNRARGDS